MQQSALDVLSDLLLRYIGEIGATAHSYAELSNRANPSADDLVGRMYTPSRLSVPKTMACHMLLPGLQLMHRLN